MHRFYPSQQENPSPAPREDLGTQTDRWTGPYIPARVAHTSPQKIVGWLDPLEVRAGDEVLLDSPFGRQRYVRTGPDAFEQVDGEWSLVFRERDGETRLFLGPFSFAYSRVPAYQTLGFQLPVGAACLALFFSTLVVFPAAFLVRRRRGAPPPPRAARLVAGLAGALNLGLLVWFVLSLLGFAETYVWPAEAVAMITRLWLLGVPLTLVVVLSVLAWKKGYWGAA